MSSQPQENLFSIEVNKKRYDFICTDGEAHFEALKEKILRVVDKLSANDTGHILSNYAMKIALLLADEAVRAEFQVKDMSRELTEKIEPLVSEIDRVLSP